MKEYLAHRQIPVNLEIDCLSGSHFAINRKMEHPAIDYFPDLRRKLLLGNSQKSLNKLVDRRVVGRVAILLRKEENWQCLAD